MEQKKILVTGGLGFIGSHTIVCLHEAGYVPVIVDNLHNSSIEVLDAVSQLIGYTPVFIQGDVNDKTLMAQIFKHINPRPSYILQHIRPLGRALMNP